MLLFPAHCFQAHDKLKTLDLVKEPDIIKKLLLSTFHFWEHLIWAEILDDDLIEHIFELLNEKDAVGGVKLVGVIGIPADWLG